MRVKIKDQVYDSESEPIMLIFTTDEQRLHFVDLINSMPEKAGPRKYAEFPSDYSTEGIAAFMKLD